MQAVLSTFPTNVGFYIFWLVPVPPLLIGAAFFVAQGRPRT
jgi:hypothetical protein